MQEEMEIKLKEQVKEQVEITLKEQLEAMKVKLLNNFKIAFTQISSCAPEVIVSNLNKEEVVVQVLHFSLYLIFLSIVQN